METQTQRTGLWMQCGRAGLRQTERAAWKHIQYCVAIDSQWEFATWHRELNPVLCDNLEEWDGVGDGKEAQEWGDISTSGWFVLMYDRNQHNIIKQLYSKKKKFKYHSKINMGNSLVVQWRRQWHPTPVLLPGESHGQRSLVGCSPWGRWESDTTEWLHYHFSLSCTGEGNGNPLQCSCLENPPGTVEPGGLPSMGSQSRKRLTEAT